MTARHRASFQVGGVEIAILSDLPIAPPPGAAAAFWQPDVDLSPRCTLTIEKAPIPADDHRELLFDSGAVWRLYRSRSGELEFDCHSPLFGPRPYKRLTIDDSMTRGTITLSDTLELEAHPLDYPLDEWLVTRIVSFDRGMEVHACGVVTAEGDGLLFMGQSGDGKTTLAQLWQKRRDVELLSDDRVIIAGEPGALRMHGTPWHGDARIYRASSAPLRALFFLHQGVPSSLERLAPAEAAALLFARSFPPLESRVLVADALTTAGRIVSQVPAFRLTFEPDQSGVDAALTWNR